MEPQKKLILRAKLIASGVIRYSQYDKISSEAHEWLAIVAEELAKIEDPAIVLNIRENLQRCGLHVPQIEVLIDAQQLSELEPRPQSRTSSNEDENATDQSIYLYRRRSNNQVSEYIEAHIRELLGRGLSKSAVARAVRVNRRVVIRVAQQAQSAQGAHKDVINDLGTNLEGR
jgi:hypothetical protein